MRGGPTFGAADADPRPRRSRRRDQKQAGAAVEFRPARGSLSGGEVTRRPLAVIAMLHEAIQNPRREQSWIAHMGNVCVKDEQSPFCSTAATSSSRPRALQDDARRSSQGRPFRAAAQRLGLELSEHVIMLGPSGTIGAPRVGGSVRSSAVLAVAIQGSSRFGDLVACQIKLTFGRRARRLHHNSACGGQAREDEAILRCGV
jgi:hypothetical protein